MHEVSLMQAVREQALAALQQHSGVRIVAISLRIGGLAGVDPEALRLAHELVMAGTPASGSQLQIEAIEPQWCCQDCQHSLPAASCWDPCLHCGARRPRLLRGRELQLVALEIA